MKVRPNICYNILQQQSKFYLNSKNLAAQNTLKKMIIKCWNSKRKNNNKNPNKKIKYSPAAYYSQKTFLILTHGFRMFTSFFHF